jgi:hypothetical protein
MNYKAVWKPLPGSQSLSLSCPCNEILYEGTRGPGKTAAQLARFRRLVGLGYGSFWRGVIFDTEYKNLTDIITQSKRMYRLFNDGARYLASASELRWVWPSGEELLFRFGKEEGDYWDYHGQEFPFVGFNELTKQQSAEFYEMMFSCRRSSFRPENYPLEGGTLLKPIPLETFSTTNPFGIGHTWVKKRFIEPAPRGTIIRETQKVFNPQTEREEDVTLIEIAWYASIQQEPNGRKTVTTQRFVQELSKVNWNWTMKQANEWIEWYVTTFRDVSTQEGENRTFQLFNPNGGL